MAVGSRAHLEKDAIAKRTAARNFLMHGFHLLVVAVAGPAVRDTQCGFKVTFLLRPYKFLTFMDGYVAELPHFDGSAFEPHTLFSPETIKFACSFLKCLAVNWV